MENNKEEYSKEYYLQNKEKMDNYSKEWKKKNRDAWNKYQAEWKRNKYGKEKSTKSEDNVD